MYLGSFLIGLGIVVLFLKLWMVPVYLALFFVWYRPQIRKEQQKLVDKFGQQYIAYCKTTSCFFPRLRTLVSFQTQNYLPLKANWLKKEWKTILVWSLVIVLVEGYEDIVSYTFADFEKEFIFLLLIVFYFATFAVLFRQEEIN